VLTLGVDLASQSPNTAACQLEWVGGRAHVRALRANVEDGELLTLARASEVVGIDSPFGWPEPFVRALLAHHGGGRWPAHSSKERHATFALRCTDHFVTKMAKVRPLSVSADRIALPAMRCAALLAELGVHDRSGDGRCFEVYPAAALVQWGLRRKEPYKGRAGAEGLARLVEALLAAAAWLDIDETTRGLLRSSDHLFDALVAALNARAAALGLTHRAPPESAELARKEGWIALPFAGTLAQLAEQTVAPTA
jgi:predicted nuclease with RNAse H fold